MPRRPLSLLLLFFTANGTGETLGIVGRTPPQSAAKLKSRQGKTPTQSGEFVLTHHKVLVVFTFTVFLFVFFLVL